MYIPINNIALLIAAVIGTGIELAWYSSRFYGETALAFSGVEYLALFIVSVIEAYVLAHVLFFMEATSLAAGAASGFWMWFGFVVPSFLVDHMLAHRQVKKYFVAAAGQLIVLISMGMILATWHL